MNQGLITPQGGPAPTAEMKINPTQLDDVTCDDCGNFTFTKVVLMKRMPALISPTGVEAFMPMDVFSCAACNHVNKRFIQGMGGWFKGSPEDADDAEVRDDGIVGSDLPGLETVPGDERASSDEDAWPGDPAR